MIHYFSNPFTISFLVHPFQVQQYKSKIHKLWKHRFMGIQVLIHISFDSQIQFRLGTAICQFSVRWIHYCGSNKSNGLKNDISHVCPIACPWLNSTAQLSSVVNKQGQRSLKMTIKSSRPLVHFSNKGQILDLILENKGFQNLQLRKNVPNNKCASRLIFLSENFFLKDSDNF